MRVRNFKIIYVLSSSLKDILIWLTSYKHVVCYSQISSLILLEGNIIFPSKLANESIIKPNP